MNKTLTNVILALALAGAAAAQAAPQRIGAAAAVSGRVTAAAPGAAERELKSGAPVFLGDRVVTAPGAKLQVLLLDETVFTVGPGSDMTLDEFVYDPSSAAGKVSAKVSKGVFRFVTGKVARRKPENMKVAMPVGTIGIRGTMVFVSVGQQQGAGAPAETVVLLGPGAGNNANEPAGAIQVGNGISSVFIDQPGFGVNIGPDQSQLQAEDMSSVIGQLSAPLEQQQAADAGTQEGPPPPGPQPEQLSGSEAAGQITAAAGAVMTGVSGLADIAQSFQDASETAVSDIISYAPAGPTLATWDDVRSRQTGIATYSGSGLATLYGTASGTYDLNLTLQVDFANRTFGGGDQSLIGLTPQSQGISDTAYINSTDFSSLSGDAVTVLAYRDGAGNISSPNFDNSVLSFLNNNGIAAAQVSLALNYNDGYGTYGTGSALALAPTSAVSTWDDVRNAGYVNTMLYSGTGIAALSGSASGVYDTSFQLLVDFTNRTYGDGVASYIKILPTGSVTPLDMTYINSTSFSALTGPAVIQLTSLSGNISNAKFDSSVVTFDNVGSGLANQATVGINYNDPQANAYGGGTVTTGPPVPGIF